MIWWLWTAYTPVLVFVFDVVDAWSTEDPDVAWLGECAWTARVDNAGMGLR
jgi:hypothetical protein